MTKLYYGVAYYDEYMPYERLQEDIKLMKEAGINVVRIAESTWSTHEPQNSVFNFQSVDTVLDAMYEAGISVIVGTPTYAIPTWMVKEHPDVLAMTKQGQGKYGARQIMDITHPVYLFYAERIIRKLISHVSQHPAVIGYQVDNETKHYGTAGENVQHRFIKYMRQKYTTIDAMNDALGLDYWSNRINSWEDFPSVVGTINGSLGAEFERFQRQLVTEFLAWQVEIVNEYKREGQFVTQNFDFEWRGHSFGIQPSVDHFAAAAPFDIAGVDIYHPSQDELTGIEISFGGDVTRSLKGGGNYYVLETQAQAFPHWTPYPGQLRLLAFSHIASGANMVSYWHWHSIHNSFETYWKGLLSHDMQPNPVYHEAKTVGADFARLSNELVNLQKRNRVAMLVSNESLTAIDWFKFPDGSNYNDVVRWMYDELFRLNMECDMLSPYASSEDFARYRVIVVPALYAASDDLLHMLNEYVEQGGHVVYSFKSGFTNEEVKVRTTSQPGIIEQACGVRYQLFIDPKHVGLRGAQDYEALSCEQGITTWMELLTPSTAETLATYDHPQWGSYAAITRNSYGKGTATYIGAKIPSEKLRLVLQQVMELADVNSKEQQLPQGVALKVSYNKRGEKIRFYLNYSAQSQMIDYNGADGVELIAGRSVASGEQIKLDGWGFCIVKEIVAQ